MQFGSTEMRVRITRKLAEQIDGVDLTNHDVGDVIDLPDRKARMLVAEGWGEEERRVGGQLRVLAFRRSNDLGHHRDEDEITRAS